MEDTSGGATPGPEERERAVDLWLRDCPEEVQRSVTALRLELPHPVWRDSHYVIAKHWPQPELLANAAMPAHECEFVRCTDCGKDHVPATMAFDATTHGLCETCKITHDIVTGQRDKDGATLKRPANGCVECSWRCYFGKSDVSSCRHPTLADEPTQPLVTQYVKNSVGPGSPEVVPTWCPFLVWPK